MMSGLNTCAMISTVPVSDGQEDRVTVDVVAVTSSPVITRSLNLEFDAEMPPGYERRLVNAVVIGTGSVDPSSQTMGLSQSLNTSAAATITLSASYGTSLNTTSPMFTPAVGHRDYYYQPAPPINTSVVGTMAQYYQPADSFQFPLLYLAALTTAMPTPPHQPVVMLQVVQNSPITLGS
ncbi:hypothetical protein Hanom_Chr10g00935821 [Helianthus anomalus]